MNRRFFFVVSCFAFVLTGCGSGISPVRGKVTLSDGQPVVGATVNFESAELKTSASGTTDAKGEFQLTTNAVNDGAPPGSYVVTVHAASPADSSQQQQPPPFDLKYCNPNSSPLKFTIEKKSNNLSITLEKAPAPAEG